MLCLQSMPSHSGFPDDVELEMSGMDNSHRNKLWANLAKREQGKNFKGKSVFLSKNEKELWHQRGSRKLSISGKEQALEAIG